MITVRSALRLINGLSQTLEVRLENQATFLGDVHTMRIPPGTIAHAPLHYAVSKIQARPACSDTLEFCRPIPWRNLTRIGQLHNYHRDCLGLDKTYRLGVRVKREAYPEYNVSEETLAGHSLTFLPPLTFLNLLPVEAEVQLSSLGTSLHHARVPPTHKTTFSFVDPQKVMELNLRTERFRLVGGRAVQVWPSAEEKTVTLAMEDDNERPRPLFLSLHYLPGRGGAVQIAISAPYWILNKTGLPLLVSQDAAQREAAGQYQESEAGRDMAPLMFSLADNDAPERLRVRLGRRAREGVWVAIWTRPIPLQPGVYHDKLLLQPQDTARPPVMYNVGVEVRGGQGLYSGTRVVLLTPQFQLDNRSSFHLIVTQAQLLHKPEWQTRIGPGCCLSWHWPQQDPRPLLAVQRADLAHWSAGFPLHQLKSFHLNIRGPDAQPHFVRVEIVLHGALYYVTFSDAEGLPPPIRIVNDSQVPVLYKQATAQADHLRAILRANTAVNYNWDLLDVDEAEAALELTAFGSKSERYDLRVLGSHRPLLYDNFFFLAFSHTFLPEKAGRTSEQEELVLDVLPNGKVILNKKDMRREQQLWRMTGEGQLVNVGASSERDARVGARRPPLVLDIIGAPDSNAFVPLMLRTADPARANTQKWTFTPKVLEDSRVCCEVVGCFVQAGEGMMAAGNSALLGPTHAVATGPPPEQWIVKQRQKPGSGHLGVSVRHEGPTRVLRLTDLGVGKSEFGKKASRGGEAELGLEVALVLSQGLGISLVNAESEELVYARLTMLNLSLRRMSGLYFLGGYVMEIQADNQLVEAENWPFLYVRARGVEVGSEGPETTEPALHLEIQWKPSPSYDSFDTFRVHMRKVNVQMEELLLWKLLAMWSEGAGAETGAQAASVESGGERLTGVMERLEEQPRVDLERPDPMKARRCYFGHLQLSVPRVSLSVVTVAGRQLPPALRALKRSYGVRLVRFENASVTIKDFSQLYYFQTLDFLVDALHKHFRQELTRQAVKILGTVDFLGNPVGLLNDVSGGVKDLVIEGNVAGFVSGLGHGVSSSMAKITGSLSDGLGKLTADYEGTQLRKSVRVAQQTSGASAVSHLYTGVKGLGIGIVGGATAIVRDPIQGVYQHGIAGLGIGIGKGVVNMVTRPVQGILDFATGAATAAREVVAVGGGAGSQRFLPPRLRLPRVTRSLPGTLPLYSHPLALAQKLLRDINQASSDELCLSVEELKVPGVEGTMRALVCTRRVYFVKTSVDGESRVQLVLGYQEVEAVAVEEGQKTSGGESISVLKIQSSLPAAHTRGSLARVSCTNKDVALRLCEEMLYAKQQFDDTRRCLCSPEDTSLLVPST